MTNTYEVTPDVANAQVALAQMFYDSLGNRPWASASLLLSTNERGHISGVIEVTDEDGVLEILDTPDSLHLPIVSVRLAMRLPDLDQSFDALVVSLDASGHTNLTVTYPGEVQPTWVLPTTV